MAKRGPQTEAGRLKCAQVKTVHGKETRAIREERSLKGAELLAMEKFCFEKGIMIGAKTRGRKSKHYHQAQRQLLSDLDQLLHTPHSDCHLIVGRDISTRSTLNIVS